MPGFASYDQIITALTTNAKNESGLVSKVSATTVAGGIYTLSYVAGTPTPLVFGTALTATQMTSAIPGAILPFTNAVSPSTKHLLSLGVGSSVAAGSFFYYDLLARYPLNGTVLTGTFASVALPARDNNGATSGAGVMAMVVNASATASTAPTLTLNYTNSAGVAGRTTGAIALLASAQHRVMHNASGMFMPLQSGDTGIQTIQSYTLSATATTTQVEIQLIRPITSYIPVLVAGGYTERDLVLNTPKLARMYDGTALQLGLLAATTSSGTVIGATQYSEN